MSAPRVFVVGGGPAGCAAAYSLAKESVDVTVFERGLPGKDKVCGDAWGPLATQLVGIFGISGKRIRALGGHPHDRVTLSTDKPVVGQAEYKSKAGWVIPRAMIDQEIRNITGACVSFRYGTLVTSLTFGSTGRPKLSFTCEDGQTDEAICDALILATGSANQLSKGLNIDGKPNRGLAISVYAEMQHLDSLILEFVASCHPGYRWIFPVSEDVANVGVCVLNGKPKANLRSLGKALLADHQAKPIGRWRGGWEPLWSGRGQYWHHRSGIVSCGDAAGLVNPHSGEGIPAALESGEQAGKAILGYLQNRNPLALEGYSKWVREHFSRDYGVNPFWASLERFGRHR